MYHTNSIYAAVSSSVNELRRPPSLRSWSDHRAACCRQTSNAWKSRRRATWFAIVRYWARGSITMSVTILCEVRQILLQALHGRGVAGAEADDEGPAAPEACCLGACLSNHFG